MIVRTRSDTDGICYAKTPFSCETLRKGIKPKNCGTYKCPFYKPFDCMDWVRLEDGDGIRLIPPEETERRSLYGQDE